MKLPPLEYRDHDGTPYAVDVLVPGYIEASVAHQFGFPCIAGTRMPVSATWMFDILDDPEELAEIGITRDQVLVAIGVHEGMEYQYSRARRKRMKDAADDYWQQINAKRANEYEPGDETGW